MADERITMTDIIAAGHCVRGAKGWLQHHGFDWRAFVRDGATEEDLLATGDALAAQVIQRKAARRG